MKIMLRKKTVATLAALLVAAVTSANALTEVQLTSIDKALAGVTAAELSAKVTQLVVMAQTQERTEVGVAIVKSVAKSNRAALISVVAAIANAAPGSAPEVAATAASIMQTKSVAILLAATKAAPGYSTAITQAVIDAVPSMQTQVLKSANKGADVTASWVGATSITVTVNNSGNAPTVIPTALSSAGEDPLRKYGNP